MSSLPIHLFKQTLMDNQSVSTGTVFSDILDVEVAISFAAQFTYSNGVSLVGSAVMQATLDGPNILNPTFVDIQQSLISLSGASNSIMVNVEKHSYSRIRFSIALSSGTANVTIKVNAKRQ